MASSPTLRPATADDAPFLATMLAVAADWRPGTEVRPVDQVMATAALAHYVAGWPAPGDHGLVAEGTDRVGARRLVGAAWYRLFPPADPGYGYVDDETPEVSIGVVEAWRGQGVGERLLRRLADDAWRNGLPALTLAWMQSLGCANAAASRRTAAPARPGIVHD